MTKPKIKVFPDYMSTGCWNEDGANCDVPECVGVANMLALKYWHEIWEYFIADNFEENERTASPEYIALWADDGEALVVEFNKCQDEYEFLLERKWCK